MTDREVCVESGHSGGGGDVPCCEILPPKSDGDVWHPMRTQISELVTDGGGHVHGAECGPGD